MKMKIWQMCSVVALSLAVASCGTKRQSGLNTTTNRIDRTDIGKSALVKAVTTEAQSWIAIKGNLQAEIGMQSKSFSSRVSLQAIRGQGIRLSVIPFPLIEAVRVWFTRYGVTIVDLINSRYVQEQYSVLSEHIGFAVDYDQIEALILAQVFVPGQGTSATALSQLNYKSLGKAGYELSGRIGSSEYQFALTTTMLLEGLKVLSSKQAKVFDAQYTYLSEVDGLKVFPSDSRYVLYGDTKPKEKGYLSLSWKRVELLNSGGDIQMMPTIKSKYERISLTQILKMIGGL